MHTNHKWFLNQSGTVTNKMKKGTNMQTRVTAFGDHVMANMTRVKWLKRWKGTDSASEEGQNVSQKIPGCVPIIFDKEKNQHY